MQRVGVRFGAHIAVADVDLRVAEGEFVAVVGPTGCGKSTLLNVVSSLMPRCEGSVQVLGRETHGLNADIGYLFQQDALMPWKTALDNAAFGLVFPGMRLLSGARARMSLA